MSEPAKRSSPSDPPSSWKPRLFDPEQTPGEPTVSPSATDRQSVAHFHPLHRSADSSGRTALTLRPDSALTLRQFYDRYVAPRRATVAERTKEADRNALNHWERLATSHAKAWFRDDFGVSHEITAEAAISNPPIGYLVDDDLTRFASALLADVAASTVAKVFRVLQPWLLLAAPRDSHNKHGKGLIPQLPVLHEMPEPPIKERRFWTEGLLQTLWNAIPDERYKALIVFDAVYGFRREDLKSITVGTPPAVLPTKGTVAFVDFAANRLWLRQSKNAKKRPAPQELPLVPFVADWLRRACLSSKTAISSQRALPLAVEVDPPIGAQPFRFLRSRNQFHERWEGYLKKVGLDQKTERKGGDRAKGAVLQFGLHSFRRLANQRLSKIDDRAARWVFGWGLSRGDAQRGQHVQAVHYDQVYTAPDYVIEAFGKLQPLPCFAQ